MILSLAENITKYKYACFFAAFQFLLVRFYLEKHHKIHLSFEKKI